MKIKLSQERKLVAVVGYDGEGLFLSRRDGSIMYLNYSGLNDSIFSGTSLEEAAKEPGRTPVYEGDTVTIQF